MTDIVDVVAEVTAESDGAGVAKSVLLLDLVSPGATLAGEGWRFVPLAELAPPSLEASPMSLTSVPKLDASEFRGRDPAVTLLAPCVVTK